MQKTSQKNHKTSFNHTSKLSIALFPIKIVRISEQSHLCTIQNEMNMKLTWKDCLNFICFFFVFHVSRFYWFSPFSSISFFPGVAHTTIESNGLSDVFEVNQVSVKYFLKAWNLLNILWKFNFHVFSMQIKLKLHNLNINAMIFTI